MLSLRIDIADGADPVVTVTAAKPFAGDKLARVSFALNFDPEKATPQPKRRLAESDAEFAARCERHKKHKPDEEPKPQRTEDESDAAYAARCGATFPHAIDVPPEYLEGLVERCREILDAVRDVGEHYADRAAAEQSLAAEGKAPPGVKQIRIGGTLKAVSNLDKEKR